MKTEMRGFGDIQRKIDRLSNAKDNSVYAVDVGIVEHARYPKEVIYGRWKRTGTPPTVAAVAIYNEFGTPKARRPIPPRPFMRNSIAISQADPNIKSIIKRGITFNDPEFDEKTANRIGVEMAGNMVLAMKDPTFPPNTEMTKKLKKSSQPLHDTSQLRRAINSVVHKIKPDDDGTIIK